MRALIIKLKLEKVVSYLGRIPNKDVMKIMKEHDLFFFTSLKEGTPHVILEALSCGLPVVCHDACGHGDVINESCGIKIPMKSYAKSIKLFTNAIKQLYNNPNSLKELRTGCINRLKEVSWETKSKQMYNYYLNAIERFKLSS